jgi:hypothetical protein
MEGPDRCQISEPTPAYPELRLPRHHHVYFAFLWEKGMRIRRHDVHFPTCRHDYLLEYGLLELLSDTRCDFPMSQKTELYSE